MPYKHGAYGEIVKSKAIAAAQADTVLLYVGVAPINLIAGYKDSGLVNKPIRLRNFNEVQKIVGYSDNWDKFSLCEAFVEHFNNTVQNAGPIYIVNVLDPEVHRGTQVSLSNQDFSSGYVYIDTDEAILDTVRVAGKVLDSDYSVSYDMSAGQVVIKDLNGTLGTTETVTYYPVDLSQITDATIIGSANADGTVTGIQCIKMMYSDFNAVTNLLAAPGYSEHPAVYQAMVSAVQKINGHWDGYVVADIPIEDVKSKEATVTSYVASVTDSDLILDSVEVYSADGTTKGVKTTDYTLDFTAGVLTVTLVSGGALYSEAKVIVKYKAKVDTKAKAIAWKAANGYTSERSDVCWPHVIDGNGKTYHLSTVFAAMMLATDLSHESIPMESPSNKIIMATGQFFGSASKNPGYDQVESNDLNEKGICTACFWDGSWRTWGPHTAAYQYGITMDPRGIFDVNMRMLMFVTNGFQRRHGIEIDTPMTIALKDSIINKEQEELDRLAGLGAIIGTPSVKFLESANSVNDMMQGDFVFDIDFTNTPPFKSGTARVCYTDDGFKAYFG